MILLQCLARKRPEAALPVSDDRVALSRQGGHQIALATWHGCQTADRLIAL